jgi:hypothetical protein
MFGTDFSFALNTDDLKARFSQLALSLTRMAESANVRVIPYRAPSLPYFSRLPEAQQRSALKLLEHYISILCHAIHSGYKLDDPKMLTWVAIKSFGFIPSSDLFHKIDPGDIVEIYDLDNFQIFRNLRFFEFCSYTVEDIYCRPWPSLFRRDETVTSEIFELLKVVYAENKVKVYERAHMPAQTVEETDSPLHYKLKIKGKYLGTLFDQSKKLSALVSVETARFLKRPLTGAQEEEFLKKYYEKTGNGFTL